MLGGCNGRFCVVLYWVRIEIQALGMGRQVEVKKMAEELDSYEEILEFAINREAQAYAFYMALAGRMVSPQKQQEFEKLAQEELEHKAKLELEMMKAGKVVKTEEKSEEEKVGYDIIGVDGGIDMGYKDILSLSISKERVAFRLYVDLAGRAKDEESREVFLELAEEEARHKFRFEIEYDNLLKKS